MLVRHDSVEPRSPLRHGTPGNAFKPELDGVQPDLMFTKHVHSAFHGAVDLHRWLTARDIKDIVLAGIQTNMCVETTARVGCDLGYRVRVAIDATHTYDSTGPDGIVVTADELTRATAATLHGEFAEIVSTKDLVGASG